MIDTNEPSLTCAGCGRQPREDENAKDDWRTTDNEGVGDGVTLCPERAWELGRPCAEGFAGFLRWS